MKTLLLLLGMVALSPGFSQVRLEKLNDAELDMGCGCSFRMPASAKHQGTRILQWQDPGPAKLRIDGKLHLLVVSEPEVSTPPDRREKVGDQVSYTLSGQDVSVLASCKAITACTEEDDSCESAEYLATLTITTPAGKSQIQAWGNCGC